MAEETWRAVIAMHRDKGLPSMLEHADHLEQVLEQHPPDQETVTLHLTDDLFLRSYNWARWQLDIPLPPMWPWGCVTRAGFAAERPSVIMGVCCAQAASPSPLSAAKETSVDAERFDIFTRSLNSSGSRRRVLTTGLAALVGTASARYHAEPTEAAKRGRKKRGRKNRNSCTSGPCTYELCLLYLDTRHYNDLGLQFKYTPYLSAHCCANYALGLTGKAYRDAVVACISQILAPTGLD
jgi:hypothetical protein